MTFNFLLRSNSAWILYVMARITSKSPITRISYEKVKNMFNARNIHRLHVAAWKAAFVKPNNSYPSFPWWDEFVEILLWSAVGWKRSDPSMEQISLPRFSISDSKLLAGSIFVFFKELFCGRFTEDMVAMLPWRMALLLVDSGLASRGGEISALGEWGALKCFKALFVGDFIEDMVAILSSYVMVREEVVEIGRGDCVGHPKIGHR